MLSESCWVLKTMLIQRPLPAGCLGYAGTLWTHLECFLATWDMSVWALTIQSEPYCPWDLCWQRTDRSKPHGCRMLRKEKLSTQEAVFHLAVTRSILKGSTRQCSDMAENSTASFVLNSGERPAYLLYPQLHFYDAWILVGCSGTLSNYWSGNLLLVYLPTKTIQNHERQAKLCQSN